MIKILIENKRLSELKIHNSIFKVIVTVQLEKASPVCIELK
jgi:hypothetical protein